MAVLRTSPYFRNITGSFRAYARMESSCCSINPDHGSGARGPLVIGRTATAARWCDRCPVREALSGEFDQAHRPPAARFLSSAHRLRFVQVFTTKVRRLSLSWADLDTFL